MSDAAVIADKPERVLGPEAARNLGRRVAEGFMERYLSGEHVLDIGYRGGKPDAQPLTEAAIGVELDYPGYDGVRLPFPDGSQDAVFASHTLEHIEDYRAILDDWFRVLKVGGFLVIAVPHQHLYERKVSLPSRFNPDHKRFYTPGSLLAEIEKALPIAAYRVRSLRDIDTGFSIHVPPERHAQGCYEIELVIEKVDQPAYASQLKMAPQVAELARFFCTLIVQAHAALIAGDDAMVAATQALLASLPLPPFELLRRQLPPDLPAPDLLEIMRPLILANPFDEAFYLAHHADVRAAVEAGALRSGRDHFVEDGYLAGRMINTYSPLFS